MSYYTYDWNRRDIDSGNQRYERDNKHWQSYTENTEKYPKSNKSFDLADKIFGTILLGGLTAIVLSTIWPPAFLITCGVVVGIIVIAGISYYIYKKIDKK